MKVLVVDDNKDVLEALCSVVENWGGEAASANGADDGKRLLESNDFDFVLLDIRMPKHDAVWFMSHVRVPPRTQVIAMSAYAPESTISELFDLGVVDYMEKPFGPDELMDVVNRHAREADDLEPVWPAFRSRRKVRAQRNACLNRRFRAAAVCYA